MELIWGAQIFPKDLENSQHSQNSQKVSATMSGMKVQKTYHSKYNIPKNLEFFVNFQTFPNTINKFKIPNKPREFSKFTKLTKSQQLCLGWKFQKTQQ